jgi:hypothetical protein
VRSSPCVPNFRLAAGRILPQGIVSHILHVRLPAQSSGLKLVGDRLNVGWINAALTDRLAVGCGARSDKIDVTVAVALRSRIGRLTADHSYIVVKTEMPNSVVVA